jgi:hypothetical protein
MRQRSVEARFWEKVKVGKANECWEWTAAKNEYGVGKMGAGGRGGSTLAAHRFAYKLAYGEIPADKQWILHTCKNLSCCNPKHLQACKPSERLESAEDRFWRKVKRGKKHECWEWQASFFPDGYGLFWFSGRNFRAPRFAYKITYGDPPPDKPWVLHKCDNPVCVNPAHLEAGTCSKNTRDAFLRGRIKPRRGEKHPLAKLTEKDVRAIRRLWERGGMSVAEIKQRYDVTADTIKMIIRRDTWKHVA